MNAASVLTIGNFDGVHLGHRKLLTRLLEVAKSESLRSVVLSYTDHPAFTLKSDAAPKVLCPAVFKLRELSSLGIDEVELLSFNSELAKTSALTFLSEYLVPVWHPKVIVMGYDSHFGHQRQGDFGFLCQHADTYHYRVEYVKPMLYGKKPISSSLIRELLSEGNMHSANKLLGKPYRLCGKVGHGTALGRSLGFPTANLILDYPHQLIPKRGVYLSKAFLDDQSFFGLTNIGSNPTVKRSGIIEIETYLLDFSAEIYCRHLEVELLQYLREEKLFENANELVLAMRQDLALARQLIAGETYA